MNYFYLKLVVATLLVFTACGCSKPAPVTPPGAEIEWGFEANAIVLQVKSSDRLNWHGDSPASLLLCVYQLNDSQALINIANAGGGMESLLKCRPFDDTVVTAERLFISPGDQKQIFMNRQQNTKQVALIAGYYELDALRSMQIWEVPLEKHSKGIFSGRGQRPKQLVMEVYLGPNEILYNQQP